MTKFEVGDRVLRVDRPGLKSNTSHRYAIGTILTVERLSPAYHFEPTLTFVEDSSKENWVSAYFEIFDPDPTEEEIEQIKRNLRELIEQ